MENSRQVFSFRVIRFKTGLFLQFGLFCCVSCPVRTLGESAHFFFGKSAYGQLIKSLDRNKIIEIC